MIKLKYKVGQKVAVHYKKDKYILDNFFDYPECGLFRKLEIVKIKKHWFYFFEEMFLLSDGRWYQRKQLTPVFRVYGY